MTARTNEAKILVKHISCNFKCKLDRQHVIQIKNGIRINVNVSVTSIVRAKKIIAGILVHVFWV